MHTFLRYAMYYYGKGEKDIKTKNKFQIGKPNFRETYKII